MTNEVVQQNEAKYPELKVLKVSSSEYK